MSAVAVHKRGLRTAGAALIGLAVMLGLGAVIYLAAKGAGWTISEFGIGFYLGIVFYAVRDQAVEEWKR